MRHEHLSARDASLVLGVTLPLMYYLIKTKQLRAVYRGCHLFFKTEAVVALRDQRAARTKRGKGRPTIGETLARRVQLMRVNDNTNAGALSNASATATDQHSVARAGPRALTEARVVRSSKIPSRRAAR